MEKKKKRKKKTWTNTKNPHFSDRIDTIILPLVCLQVQEEFYLPIHHTSVLWLPYCKDMAYVVYSPSRSIGPGMDSPLNFSETDH